jgi:hypothetical protein
MEIKGCRFAQNKTYAECLAGMAPALLTIATAVQPFKQTEFLTTLKGLCVKQGWGYKLLTAMLNDDSHE